MASPAEEKVGGAALSGKAAAEAARESDLEGGSYDVLCSRLSDQGRALAARADALNLRRKEVFGGIELTVIGNERVRTENNCIPADVAGLGDLLLIGYDVHIGLRSETSVKDIFSLYQFTQTETGFDLSPVSLDDAGGFLQDEVFTRELRELFQYYKSSRLLQLRQVDGKLLFVFQVGASALDFKVFRWRLDGEHPAYIDNRGERDHVFPPSPDFEWIPTAREDHVAGVHPHVSILDQVFVETVGGDLTIKVENNTDDGQGIYREPVEDADQALDDAQIFYAKVGRLILLKILPFHEESWRYYIFNGQTSSVLRVDSIGQACVQLPENHGIIFPGGYYLQNGSHKVFDGDTTDLEFQRLVRSANGEDVLYVFLRRADGHYVLFPYNVIRKEVQNPVRCNGYSLFPDGRMVIFRVTTDEATRVHPMQIWQTPFTSVEHEAGAPTDGSYLSKVGNADLVRGISDAYSICRLTENPEPSRDTYEDMIGSVTRMIDSFYWLDHKEVGNLRASLNPIRTSAELIIDEFEKVLAIRRRSAQSLAESEEQQRELMREVRPQDLRSVDAFMGALTALRQQRGRLITLREMRYIALSSIDRMEQAVIEQFDRVSESCVDYLLKEEALRPLFEQVEQLMARIEEVTKTTEMKPLQEQLEQLGEGLNVLTEIVGGLEVGDPTDRTRILEGISEVFAQLNRVRATMEVRRKSILSEEGSAEFAAQFKLLQQSADSALSRGDTPEACDEQLSRVMLQLEEVESRFSEFDEFIATLTAKREEIYEAFSAKKQTLVEQRQRRAQNLMTAAKRILEGVGRRARKFDSDDQLNAYFASDPMLVKLRDLIERLKELEESVKADELDSRLKSARQDALRLMRDRSELFEEGATVIRFGHHRFSVNTQPLELTMLPHGEAMAFNLTGTDFYQPVDSEAFNQTQEFWDQTLVSENSLVCRAEYLAASMLQDAEAQQKDLTLEGLIHADLGEGGLLEVVRQYAASRYDEGYERGVHDADAALILSKLLALRSTAGLLRFAPHCRALACLFWATFKDHDQRALWVRKASSLGRLRASFEHSPAFAAFAAELSGKITQFTSTNELSAGDAALRLAGQYLAEELMTREHPAFITSAGAMALRDALLAQLEKESSRDAFTQDLRSLFEQPAEGFHLAQAWIDAFIQRSEDPAVAPLAHNNSECAVLLLTEGHLDRQVNNTPSAVQITGLLGQHRTINNGALDLRLDDFLDRLGHFLAETAPRFRDYRKLRQRLIQEQRHKLRLEEFKPRVLTSFVRNRLINEVYLPLIGDNLAKQLGTAGVDKRTDLMGLLLLVSPPGYGKTTLMEYLASQLGLIFMKVNGPSLGHSVTSLDPGEVKSATARREVEKINLALEMGNNVMLYLDDIQHTHPELLQKFISLCDAQRRIEGVWNGQARTYDLRGKKFCVVMAGNPYTESGDKFQIPDMLANRADTYNLGDILDGKEEIFALSYIENSLTSNPTLAPLASRKQSDIYLLIRMARGDEVPSTDLSYPYSAAEINEMVGVLKHIFAVQELLLKVNQQYILSAAQDDAYRTEPSFQLQGSYRNMNKLAEKVVSAMNEEELSALLRDHYTGEAQTLTSGAEHNLLKLGEIRGVLDEEGRKRWEEIKSGFQRTKRMGGAEDDPAVRVVGQLSDIGERLDGLRQGVLGAAAQAATSARVQSDAAAKTAKTQSDAAAMTAKTQSDSAAKMAAERNEKEKGQTTQLLTALGKLDKAMTGLANPTLQVDLTTKLPAGVSDLLDQQVGMIDRIINPLVHAMSRSIQEGDSVRVHLMALIDDLKRIDKRLKQSTPEELQQFAKEMKKPRRPGE